MTSDLESQILDISPEDEAVLARVIKLLASEHPLIHELEQYIIGYSVLGRMSAEQQARQEVYDLQKKEMWSRAFIKAKEAKYSDRAAAALADIETVELEAMVIQTKRGYTTLRNMRDAVQEAINAVKHLNRNGG